MASMPPADRRKTGDRRLLLDRRSGVDRRFGGERRRVIVAVARERRAAAPRRHLDDRRDAPPRLRPPFAPLRLAERVDRRLTLPRVDGLP
jgi:hypothetical protein